MPNIKWIKKQQLKLQKNDLTFLEKPMEPLATSRICLHSTAREKMHVMLIKIKKGFQSSIHRHKNTPEYYIFYKGKIKIEIFFKKKLKLVLDKNNKIIKIPKNVYHRVSTIKSKAYFFEVKNGPFISIK